MSAEQTGIKVIWGFGGWMGKGDVNLDMPKPATDTQTLPSELAAGGDNQGRSGFVKLAEAPPDDS